jgi:hypothetical protein
MAGANLTTLDKILKELYLPNVTEQLNNEVLLLQRLESSTEEIVGRRAIVAVHKARSGAVGLADEDAALPASGNQQYENVVYNLKYLYGRVGVTGPAMAKTAKEAGSFLKALQSEIDGIRNDLKKDLGRQVWGSGLGNGLIAKCGTTTASNNVVLATDEALRKGHIHIGMRVDIGTAPNASDVATLRDVTGVDIPSKTVTISGAAVTTSGSHFVARAGNGGKEITGMTEIVSTAPATDPGSSLRVGTLDPSQSANSFWRNIADGNAGNPRAISQHLLATIFNESRIAGGEVSLLTGSFGMEREIFEILQPQVRYTEPTSLKGGYKALDFKGKPFVADVDHPFGRVHCLDERFLKVFNTRDWHFLDEDGNVLKWVSGFDKWEAVLARYMNMGATRRNTQGVLFDLSGDTTGV